MLVVQIALSVIPLLDNVIASQMLLGEHVANVQRVIMVTAIYLDACYVAVIQKVLRVINVRISDSVGVKLV